MAFVVHFSPFDRFLLLTLKKTPCLPQQTSFQGMSSTGSQNAQNRFRGGLLAVPCLWPLIFYCWAVGPRVNNSKMITVDTNTTTNISNKHENCIFCLFNPSPITSNFSYSHSVVYLFGKLFVIFIEFKIVIC